jgi:predicted O-methyltransferase YrrM
MADIRHLARHLTYQLAGRVALHKMKPESRFDSIVAASIARALQGRLSADERLWSESIERMRRTLSRDDTLLQYTDYGRVSAESDKPQVVSRTIGKVQADSVPPHQGLTLHVLVRDVCPSRCLELGTSLGISTAYIASGLEVNERGKLTTLEGGKDLSRVASINFSRLGLANTRFVTGPFEDQLPDVLRDVGQVDFAHVDGHHNGPATQAYFRQILQHSAPHAVMVFDDIRWSRGMRDAWRAIRSHERVTSSIDLFSFGVCVIGPRETAT